MIEKLNPPERQAASTPDRRTFVTSLVSATACLAGLAMASKAGATSLGKRLSTSGSARHSGSASSDPHQPQVPFLYWTWGEIRRGDCTVAPGSRFYLYANGATRWVCDLRSSDSGDEWDGRFEVKNASGQVLAATPGYHFDISQENVTRHWDESRGPNSSLAAAYPSASTINFICSC